ncbi:hypothetical protein I7I53_05614 [Histoplasma capsulatum var. duboisii H88]|uniref:Uncharacterized protein n=1 Tax=Ajellomyces capsulatus (strain H88) TaxID=544711 RepID=A0A8A1LXQ4_AJEC8|nr:hypothetical protein I7I53_05614 [Histoplasma capsulatum var. duboisii H88]
MSCSPCVFFLIWKRAPSSSLLIYSDCPNSPYLPAGDLNFRHINYDTIIAFGSAFKRVGLRIQIMGSRFMATRFVLNFSCERNLYMYHHGPFKRGVTYRMTRLKKLQYVVFP